MNSSDQSPKLPLWIFIATDLALIGAAIFIAARSVQPLTMEATLAVVGCLGLGAIVGLVPIILHFERLKNEELDERQRALEALARTVTSSAEQISIAASGLHEIAELAQKNLRHAEQLPHKLQEKIAEFQAQLATADEAEKEELERELLALRTTEGERLESVSQRIAKSAAEWTKLEQATQQQLAAAQEALAKLSLGTASAIGKAQAAAEQTLGASRLEAARAIENARRAALTELDAKFSDFFRLLDERLARTGEEKRETGAPEESVPATTPAPIRRSRRPREDNDAPAVPASAAPEAAAPPKPIVAVEEPPPIPRDAIAEIEPVAPATAEPFTGRIVGSPGEVPASANGGARDPHPPAEPSPLLRKRASKKPGTEEEPGLGLKLDDTTAAASMSERVRTSDGATRLLVTAYIGIGNRLFIRGAGPGLSWEKGVPLQFVSIGKWRWETNDAVVPMRFKLYKNDEIECTLGAQTLEPGHQQEVTAAF
jgi:hypothetical protein